MGVTSPSFSGGAGIVTSDKIVSADLEIDGTTIVVDETNNRVGVGTGSPSTTLDVSGGITATSGNDATGTISVRSGNAAQYSKISMGTNGNKATLGCAGATDTFFTGVAQDDLVVRADDNNSKVHIGAGTSGPAAMVVTEVANVGKVGIGTTSPGAQLDIQDTTTSSANTGGALRLSANDGAAMGDSHRLGVIEFTGAEDAGGSQTVGARIEVMTDALWNNAENGASMYLYTTDGNASQSIVLKLDSNKKATFAGRIQGDGGSVSLKEKADADADTAAYGQLWCKTATPNELYFTTDAGDDIQLTTGTGAAGGGASLANDGNNRVTTGTGSGGINGEANLLFDGSTLKVNGGVGANVRGTGASGLTGTVTVAATDYFLGCDPSGGTVTCNLPAPSIAGQMFVIKDTDGTASGTNKITITAQAGDSIDGGSTGGSVHITTPNASVTIITDGTHWFLI